MYAAPHQMEPLLPPGNDAGLEAQAQELALSAAQLEGAIHGQTREAVAALVREMNCYYSNLIEGHKTLPLDIERALHRDFSQVAEVEKLQRLAKAHIDAEIFVAQKVDNGASLTDPAFICKVHEVFCEGLPESLLRLEDGSMMVPGKLRQVEVQVGRHVPPAWKSLPAFLDRFAEGYGKIPAGMDAIAPIMAAHHRLAWIHPFPDGNGRVARLITGAMLRRAGVCRGGLWSLSRGLARAKERYKAALQEADEPRRGDLDGRGNLSAAGLVGLCRFMTEAATDQVRYMSEMLDLTRLKARVEHYFTIVRTDLRSEAAHLLSHAVGFGELARGDAGRVAGLSERVARDLVGQLQDEGFLVSESSRAPLRAGFPVKARDAFFPKLYPAGTAGGPEVAVRRLARATRAS